MKRVYLHLTRPGYVIGICIVVLCGIGVACIFATEHAAGGRCANTIKQALFVVVGIGAAVVTLRIGYQRIAPYAYLLFAAALLLLIPLMIAKLTGFEFGGLVPGRRNAYRWIRLPGFQLQPSEFMKIAYVLALAQYLRYRKNYRTLRGMLVPIGLSAVPMLFILTEPDLGTVLLMIPVLFIMLFAAGARKRHLALVLGLAVVVAPLVWLKIAPYQRLRITGLLLQSESLRAKIAAHPERYAHLCTKRQALYWERDSGWQLVGSKAALGSGGLLGEGWGRGTYVEYNFLPDRHNDFVFALVGHQWGLVGCVVVLACYAVLVIAAMEIASLTVEPFGRLLAVGVLAFFATQVLINVGMTMGLMPITGMTLPFVSYGGSSLVTSFVAAALLVSVSQHRPFILAKKPFDYAEP
ncbi:MAG: FtsW/RodA/SpoVE family cell cycle protein [Phycisphaerae bacterium]|nr:FtsW/RodA/SpoVE family cell cycle protein [Phycisphaerae bacterium]